MKLFLGSAFLLTTILVLSINGFSQVASGGSYVLAQSVIADGGGFSTATAVTLGGTIGQATAHNPSSGGTYALEGGFWNLLVGPTAAGVTVAGRVLSSEGRGVRSAEVRIADFKGNSWRQTTGPLGNFTFEDVPTGETYLITVTSRRFTFEPVVIQVNDSVTDLTITASPPDARRETKR